ncbi:MAG: OmpH family outer membrane protein [Cyclobacteriaceae bacterium]|nr:OmpH family outer membrane protein [Cyclobacteriaceae bacterium]
MKNISVVLNVVLALAVVVLYYLHFSGSSSSSSVAGGSVSNLAMAYVNADTVLKYYDYSKVGREKLEAKGKQLDQDLNARAASLQGEFESYQRNVNNMTIGQARAVEEDLTKKRNNLQLYQESLSQQMLIEQEKMNKELYDKVTAYLKKYSQERGVQIIFKYNVASDVLFASDSLDISKEVIKGLNEAYQLEKQSQKPAAKDSVDKAKKK